MPAQAIDAEGLSPHGGAVGRGGSFQRWSLVKGSKITGGMTGRTCRDPSNSGFPFHFLAARRGTDLGICVLPP